MQFKSRFLVCAAVLSLSGCATIFGTNDHSVQVDSKPQGADVYLNTMSMGTTPIKLPINTWSPGMITLKKPGYKTQSVLPQTQFQMVGILDVFFWPGFIIDAAAGNTMKIAPESRLITINLTEGKD